MRIALIFLFASVASAQTTITVGASATNVHQLGYWGAPASFNGRTAILPSGDSASIAFSCNPCTSIAVDSYSTNPFLVYVDGVVANGGTAYAGSGGAGTWSWVAGPSGLSAGSHYINIASVVGQFLYLDSINTIQVTASTTPAIADTDFLDATATYAIGNATLLASSRLDAAPRTATVGGYASRVWQPGGGLRVNINASTSGYISVWGTASGTSSQATYNAIWTLYQDGTSYAVVNLNQTSGSWAYVHFSVPSGVHTYTIRNESVTGYGGSGQATYSIYQVYLTSGVALAGTQPAALSFIGAIGDSTAVSGSVIGLGSGNLNNASKMWPTLGAGYLGLASQNTGVAGSTMVAQASNVCTLANYAASPLGEDMVWGVNDMDTGESLGSYQTAIGTALTNLSGCANAPAHILVMPIFATTATGSGGNAAQFRAAASAAVTSYNAGSPAVPACYVDPSGWSTTANTELSSYPSGTPDGIHPNYTSQASIGAHLPAIYTTWLGNTSFTATGPSTGNAGVPVALTLTSATGTTFTGDVIITPSSTGGTFSPATITPGNGTTTATVYFTAASSGSASIAFNSTALCWSYPSLSITFSSTPLGTGVYGGVSLYGVSVQ